MLPQDQQMQLVALQGRPLTGSSRPALAADFSDGPDAAASIDGTEGLFLWQARGLPAYMQAPTAGVANVVPFNVEDTALRAAYHESATLAPPAARELVWRIMRREAVRDAVAEPVLSSALHACILSHDSFEQALAFVLAKRLASSTLLAMELGDVFLDVLHKHSHVAEAALEDVRAVFQRDPACTSYSHALLHYKGFHAIQAHRIAHELHTRSSCVMAAALQSRMSEAFAVDIHPGARFGSGILLDHGTGVVIGETVVLGDNVSILHGVTLGGTGKEDGDRHPKISDNVLIGACARILGNIRVAAGSTVLRPVPPHTLVAGSPAREIGTLTGNPATSMDHSLVGTSGSSEVESVTSERAARKRWPVSSTTPPPEYLI
ncbi:hypothetical protein ABPG75_007919 [Micractinium tetrahymenae]